jgi:hypothetical protein
MDLGLAVTNEGYCSVKYRCYATIARRNMRCLVAAGKHLDDIQSVARQPPMTTIEGLLDVVFSVGSALRLYSEEHRQ